MSQAIEARLSYLGFQLIPPRLELQPYVRSYWLMHRERSLAGYREEFMHGVGNFGLVFNLGEGVRLDHEPIQETVFLDGANTRSRKMGFEGVVRLLGVQFQLGAAYPFLGVPLNEIVNRTSLVDVLAEDAVMPLYDRLRLTLSFRDQINVIEDWLMHRLAVGKNADALVWDSAQAIRRYNGLLSIDQLAARLSISQRQLERLYHIHLGIAPKQYARLLRVDAARNTLRQARPLSLTDLGLQVGFYDQSHFIREFKAVVGMTPSAYLEHSQSVRENSVGIGL